MPNYRRVLVPGGAYFFTVNVRDRRSNLLTDRIEDFRLAYSLCVRRYPFTTEALVVLPDHIHALWLLPAGDSNYSARWQLIKAMFSRRVRNPSRRHAAGSRRRDAGLWQPRFWEHMIRNEQDFAAHYNYLTFNPVKHGLVSRVVDWPYSTFHRDFVRGRVSPDWGGTGEPLDGIFGERA